MKKRIIFALLALSLLLSGCGTREAITETPMELPSITPQPPEKQAEITAPAETELRGTPEPEPSETPTPPRLVEHDYVTSSLIRVYTEYERYGESAEHMTFFIENGGGIAAEYGSPFEVLRETEQGWVHAAPDTDAWTMELRSTPPGELRAGRVWIGGLGPGNYRLVKEINRKWYAAPFVICADEEAEVTLERPFGREPLSALPSEYGEAEARENGDLVLLPSGKAENREVFDRFLMLVDAEAQALLRMVRYDEAGGAVITDVVYNGIRYSLTEDATRLGGAVRTRYFSCLTVRDGRVVLTDCWPGEADNAWLLNRAEEEVLFSFDADSEAWDKRLRKHMEAYKWRSAILYVPSPEGDTFAGINADGDPLVELRRSGMRGMTLWGFADSAPELERWIGIRWEDTEHFVLFGENRDGSESPYIAVTMEVRREKNYFGSLADIVGTEALREPPFGSTADAAYPNRPGVAVSDETVTG